MAREMRARWRFLTGERGRVWGTSPVHPALVSIGVVVGSRRQLRDPASPRVGALRLDEQYRNVRLRLLDRRLDAVDAHLDLRGVQPIVELDTQRSNDLIHTHLHGEHAIGGMYVRLLAGEAHERVADARVCWFAYQQAFGLLRQ